MTELYFHIGTDGQITNPPKIREAFKLQPGTYVLTIRSFKKRTIPQNKYYWRGVLPLVLEGLRHNGYNEVKTVADAHEVLKHVFLKRAVANEETGEVIATIAGSTADLSTIDFNAFIEEVIKWSIEYLGVTIPPPGSPISLFTQQ